MAWTGHLALDYRHDGERTLAHDRYGGPLRVLRALAACVEPAMDLLQQVWTRWRDVTLNLPACGPRVWRT